MHIYCYKRLEDEHCNIFPNGININANSLQPKVRVRKRVRKREMDSETDSETDRERRERDS